MAAITMAEAHKLIQNPLQKGVVETVARESSVLELLPIINLDGNAYSYIQEDKMATVNFRDINEGYIGNNPTYLSKTEQLKLLGGTVEVDRFIELTQNIHDVRAEATASKAKAIANEFTRVFFKGNASTNPLEFNGLGNRALPSQIVDAQGFQLHTGLLHQVLDMVMGGADVLFMNKQTRRKVTSLFMAQTAYVQAGQDAFGRPQQYFGDVRIAVVEDMFIPDNSIYAVKFGADAGITGIQAGDITAVDNGLRGNTYETLIEWYVSITDTNPKGFAILKNFSLEF